jgi:hypothetical protein
MIARYGDLRRTRQGNKDRESERETRESWKKQRKRLRREITLSRRRVTRSIEKIGRIRKERSSIRICHDRFMETSGCRKLLKKR